MLFDLAACKRIANKYKSGLKAFLMLLGAIGLLTCLSFWFFTNTDLGTYLRMSEHNFAKTGLNEGIYSQVEKEETIRFHILANSDSIKDQKIKLDVRDIITHNLQGELDNAEDMDEAKKIIKEKKPVIFSKIKQYMKENEYNYEIKLKLEEKEFPTRRYDDGVLEGEKYLAFKGIIGEGKGQNWWCVLFPPLCYVDLAVEEDCNETKGPSFDYEKDFEEDEKSEKEIKFLIYEWFKEMF